MKILEGMGRGILAISLLLTLIVGGNVAWGNSNPTGKKSSHQIHFGDDDTPFPLSLRGEVKIGGWPNVRTLNIGLSFDEKIEIASSPVETRDSKNLVSLWEPGKGSQLMFAYPSGSDGPYLVTKVRYMEPNIPEDQPMVGKRYLTIWAESRADSSDQVVLELETKDNVSFKGWMYYFGSRENHQDIFGKVSKKPRRVKLTAGTDKPGDGA